MRVLLDLQQCLWRIEKYTVSVGMYSILWHHEVCRQDYSQLASLGVFTLWFLCNEMARIQSRTVVRNKGLAARLIKTAAIKITCRWIATDFFVYGPTIPSILPRFTRSPPWWRGVIYIWRRYWKVALLLFCAEKTRQSTFRSRLESGTYRLLRNSNDYECYVLVFLFAA